MRKWLSVFVIAVAVSACGSKASPTSPANNTAYVKFRLDANSCSALGTATLNMTFYIDGATVGSANVSLSTTSPAYSVTAGSHVASASVSNYNIRWESLTFSVAAGQTWTYILQC